MMQEREINGVKTEQKPIELPCPHCGRRIQDGKCSACGKDYSDLIQEAFIYRVPEYKKTAVTEINSFMNALKECRTFVRIIDTTINPIEYFDAHKVIEKYLKELKKTIYFDDAVRAGDLYPIIKEVDEITRHARTDEIFEIEFINRCMKAARTKRDREILLFRFASCIDMFDILPAVRINEVFWSFGMWHGFDIGIKYRADKEKPDSRNESADVACDKEFNHALTIDIAKEIERRIRKLLREEVFDSSTYGSRNDMLNSELMQSDYFLEHWDSYRSVDGSGCYVILSYSGNDATDRMKYHDVYVGQSETVCQRVRNHLTGHGNGDVYCDIRNGETVYIKIISCPPSEMNNLEKRLIDIFDATKSYNKTAGGSAIR